MCEVPQMRTVLSHRRGVVRNGWSRTTCDSFVRRIAVGLFAVVKVSARKPIFVIQVVWTAVVTSASTAGGAGGPTSTPPRLNGVSRPPMRSAMAERSRMRAWTSSEGNCMRATSARRYWTAILNRSVSEWAASPGVWRVPVTESPVTLAAFRGFTASRIPFA